MPEKIRIITNNQYRLLLSYWELTDAQRAQVDNEYSTLNQSIREEELYFVYKTRVHCLCDYMDVRGRMAVDIFPGWDGYTNDTFFSGILIKFNADLDAVKVGWFYS